MQQSGAGRAPVPGTSTSGKVIQFPLTRLVIAMVVVIVTFFVLAPTVGGLPIVGTVDFLVIAPAVIFVYAAYVRLVERRAATELSASRAPSELGLGVLLGAAWMAATVGIIWLLGGYEFTWTYAWSAVFAAFASAIVAGVWEEILFRGVIFRITEEALGTWLGLAVSAIVFGLVHLMNPSATVTGAAFIVLEAGILLSALYVLTRRLWASIGTHAAWNFVQGGIFGVTVSGTEAKAGLLSAEPVGPVLLSGGEFGVEGSIVAIVLGLVLGVYFFARAVQRGRIVKPFWQRRNVVVRNGEALTQQVS